MNLLQIWADFHLSAQKAIGKASVPLCAEGVKNEAMGQRWEIWEAALRVA